MDLELKWSKISNTIQMNVVTDNFKFEFIKLCIQVQRGICTLHELSTEDIIGAIQSSNDTNITGEAHVKPFSAERSSVLLRHKNSS